MKVLVIAPQPFFSPRGTPFSVYFRTLITAELEVDIDLLTYGEGQDVSIPRVRIIRIPKFSFLGPVKIGPSPLKLFLDIFMVLWTVWLLIRNRYDVVHAHEEAVFYCRFLKPVFGFKMIYDMHSSLPQQLTNFKFTESSALIGSFRWLEDSALRAADAVITICPDLAEYALGRIDDKDKHFLIENSIFDAVNLADPVTSPGTSPCQAAPIAKPVPKGRDIVVYAGTLESNQGIDLLIKSFAVVRNTHPNAFLVVVGGSQPQVEAYSKLADEVGISENSMFTGRVPQQLAKAYCKQAAVQVSPRLHGTNTPLKVYEQLASGIPLVATNIYSHTQVLDDDIAVMVDPEPGDMARGLIEALTNPSARARRIEGARRLYRERYSREVYTAKMTALMARVA